MIAIALVLARLDLAAPASQTVALTGATVHSFVPGDPPRVATILWDVDRIVAVGPDVAIPADATRIDVSGYHVVPGLVDALVNHDPDHDRLYVDAGITLVNDLGGDLARQLAEATADARERAPGPALWTAGAALDGVPPSSTTSLVCVSTADVDGKLGPLFDLEPSVDWIHVESALTKDAWSRIVERSHTAKKRVWGPRPKAISLVELCQGGQDGVFHLDALLPAGKTWETAQLSDFDPAIAALVEHGTAVVPTIAIYARALLAPENEKDLLDALGPYYVQTWQADLAVRKSIVTPEYLKRGLAVLDLQQKLLARLVEKGVRVLPGSGTPYAWMFPGTALLDEMQLWKRAGLAPERILRAATADACLALGVTYRGTIEKGKIADLVVTKDDPTVDLGALHRPAKVVLRGRVMDRTQLDHLREDLVARERAVRAEFEKPIEVGAPEVPAGDVVMHGRVETRGIGVRVSGERWAVVRGYDGTLTYVGHVRVLGQASLADTETWVRQHVVDGELADFDLRTTSNGHAVTFQGQLAGGKLNVRRTVDGGFVDSLPTPSRISFLDVGSVTSLLILAHEKRPSEFNVLFVDEPYEPAVGKWQLALDKDGVTHLVKTHEAVGVLTAKIDEHGALVEAKRASGNGIVETKPLELVLDDPKGLPMPADKKSLAGTGPRGPARATPADAPKKQ